MDSAMISIGISELYDCDSTSLDVTLMGSNQMNTNLSQTAESFNWKYKARESCIRHIQTLVKCTTIMLILTIIILTSLSLIVLNNYMDLCNGYMTLIFMVCVDIMIPLSLHKSIILSCAPTRRSQVESYTTVPNQSQETWLWHDNMIYMRPCGKSYYWSCIPTDGGLCMPLTSTRFVATGCQGELACQVPMGVKPARSFCAASCKCFTVRRICQVHP